MIIHNKRLLICIGGLYLALAPWALGMQGSARRILGEVTSLAVEENRMTVRLDNGEEYRVLFQEGCEFLQVQPGQTSLQGATRVTADALSVEDRVLVSGEVDPQTRSVRAGQVVTMSRNAIAEKREQERQEWLSRGVAGTVSAVDRQKREITLQTRTLAGAVPLLVRVAPGASVRRYAQHSVKFEDSRPSVFEEIEVGHSLRALGERSSDGTVYEAQRIVFGSFAMAGGIVTAVDPAGEIVIDNIPTGKPLRIALNRDSQLRRLPEEMALMLARRLQGGAVAGAPVRPGGEAGPGGPPARRGGEPGSGPTAGPGAGFRGQGGDLQRMLERLPPIAFQDLKPGDAVLLSSIVGQDPERVTAILLVTGVEELFRARPGSEGTVPLGGGSWAGDLLDFSSGFPPD